MKSVCLWMFFLCLITLPVHAEEAARLHAFGGYQYFRDGFADGANLSGVEGAFSADVTKHFGIASDFSRASHNYDHLGTDRVTTYTFGPVVSLSPRAQIDPFAHILVGGTVASLKANNFNLPLYQLFASVNYLAIKVGGGIDVKVNRLLSVRGFQLDWNYLHGHNVSYKDEVSAATGVVFNF